MPYSAAILATLSDPGGYSDTVGADAYFGSSPISSKNRSCSPPGVWLTSILPGSFPTFLWAWRLPLETQISDPAPASMVRPSTRNSYSPSSTQKASSSRCWTWVGTPLPGGVFTSKSEYAPPVWELTILNATSSPRTHSDLAP